MAKSSLLVTSGLILITLVLSACTGQPVTPSGRHYTFCEVTDVGTVDDGSFRALGWAGMTAVAQRYSNVAVKYLESRQRSDFAGNIEAFIQDDCDLIVSVGSMIGEATLAAARAHPDQKFAIVDVRADPAITNVRGNDSHTAEAAFLAGYLAAGMSTTGIVGTYVGLLLPDTQAFVDGYAMGVARYNDVHGTAVQVIGWDMTTQGGLVTGDFENITNGRTMAQTLLESGADIIMPVAGPVGAGSLAVLAERRTGLLIGVDQDWSVTAPDYKDYVLASVLKKIDIFVMDACEDVMAGTFKGGEDYSLTLANGGVALGYGSAWDSKVPPALRAEVEALTPRIIAGDINVTPTR